MKEIRTLRRTLGARWVANSVSLANRGRVSDALAAADRAASVDPSLHQPHAIAAKLQFWTGNLDAAQRHLEQARSKGLDASDCSAMQHAIDEMRERGRIAARARAHLAELRTARRTAGLEALDAFGVWCTTQRLAMVVMLLAIVVTLMLAVTYPGVVR
jgi:hypothetical protein